MAIRKYTYKGKTIEELQKMSLEEFAALTTSRIRRSLKRGFTDQEKKLLKGVRKGKDYIKTHCRDMIIIPELVGRKFAIYNGKEFISVDISLEMVGHRLGEFSLGRKEIKHSAPGFGATKSSKYVPLK